MLSLPSLLVPAMALAAVGLALPTAATRTSGCTAAVAAARAEWRAVSHGSHLGASQPVTTRDGRRLTGALVNYAAILIGRADDACAAAMTTVSLSEVGEAESLLRPAPGRD